MATHTENLQHVDNDKRIALYRRTDAKSAYWQARFRINGQRKYKRLTTKLTNFDEAKRWALRKHMELDYAINTAGEAITSMSFKDVAQRWLAEREREWHRGEIAEGTFKRDEGTTKRYLVPFFGSKAIGHIKQTDLDEFRQWREDYWVTGVGADKQHKRNRVPSSNTIRQENISLRMILRKAVEMGQLRHETFERYVWKGQSGTRNRRPHFDQRDYRKLVDFMRRNDWLEHEHSRVSYDRKLLRDYVLVMANTGMRVGEQRHLRWKDVEWATDKDKNEMLVCRTDGKTGKRTVICNEGTDKYFERIKELTGHAKADDWVWAKRDGSLKKDFSVGFGSLREAVFGEGDERTLYSLRHTYATFKIINENMNLKKLAEQMGTSVAMIDKYYGHLDFEAYGGEMAVKSVIKGER